MDMDMDMEGLSYLDTLQSNLENIHHNMTDKTVKFIVFHPDETNNLQPKTETLKLTGDTMNDFLSDVNHDQHGTRTDNNWDPITELKQCVSAESFADIKSESDMLDSTVQKIFQKEYQDLQNTLLVKYAGDNRQSVLESINSALGNRIEIEMPTAVCLDHGCSSKSVNIATNVVNNNITFSKLYDTARSVERNEDNLSKLYPSKENFDKVGCAFIIKGCENKSLIMYITGIVNDTIISYQGKITILDNTTSTPSVYKFNGPAGYNGIPGLIPNIGPIASGNFYIHNNNPITLASQSQSFKSVIKYMGDRTIIPILYYSNIIKTDGIQIIGATHDKLAFSAMSLVYNEDDGLVPLNTIYTRKVLKTTKISQSSTRTASQIEEDEQNCHTLGELQAFEDTLNPTHHTSTSPLYDTKYDTESNTEYDTEYDTDTEYDGDNRKENIPCRIDVSYLGNQAGVTFINIRKTLNEDEKNRVKQHNTEIICNIKIQEYEFKVANVLSDINDYTTLLIDFNDRRTTRLETTDNKRIITDLIKKINNLKTNQIFLDMFGNDNGIISTLNKVLNDLVILQEKYEKNITLDELLYNSIGAGQDIFETIYNSIVKNSRIKVLHMITNKCIEETSIENFKSNKSHVNLRHGDKINSQYRRKLTYAEALKSTTRNEYKLNAERKNTKEKIFMKKRSINGGKLTRKTKYTRKPRKTKYMKKLKHNKKIDKKKSRKLKHNKK